MPRPGKFRPAASTVAPWSKESSDQQAPCGRKARNDNVNAQRHKSPWEEGPATVKTCGKRLVKPSPTAPEPAPVRQAPPRPREANPWDKQASEPFSRPVAPGMPAGAAQREHNHEAPWAKAVVAPVRGRAPPANDREASPSAIIESLSAPLSPTPVRTRLRRQPSPEQLKKQDSGLASTLYPAGHRRY